MSQLLHLLSPGWGAKETLAALLIAMRLLPLLVIAPWCSATALPWWIRLLCVAVFATVYAGLLPHRAPSHLELGSVIGMVGLELLRGVVWAVAVAVPLYALTWAAQHIGVWQVLPASTESSGVALTQLLEWWAVALFCALGGLASTFELLGEGLLSVPVGTVVTSPAVAPLSLALGVVKMLGQALRLSLQVAAPVAAALLCFDAVSAVAARVGASATVHLAPARQLLLIAVVLMSLPWWAAQLPRWWVDARQSAASTSRLGSPP